MVSVAPVITGITFLFTFRMRSTCVVRFSYYKIFEASFLITFVPPEIAISVKRHVPFFSRITLFILLIGTVLLVFTLLIP